MGSEVLERLQVRLKNLALSAPYPPNPRMKGLLPAVRDHVHSSTSDLI